MVRVHGVREVHRMNWFDSVVVGHCTSIILFGHNSPNIGHYHLSNIQVGGMLASDQTCRIENWYARTDFDRTDEAKRAFERLAHYAMVTFQIGEMPRWQSSLHDLLRTKPWIPQDQRDQTWEPEDFELYGRRLGEGFSPAVVPIRQCVSAWLTFPQEDLEAFQRANSCGTLLPRVWIHLEGNRSLDRG